MLGDVPTQISQIETEVGHPMSNVKGYPGHDPLSGPAFSSRETVLSYGIGASLPFSTNIFLRGCRVP